MLKAVQIGQYYKNGGLNYTYLVTGPSDEVTSYLAMQSIATNRPVDQLPRGPKGEPLYFVSLNAELRFGRTPKASYQLIKSFDGTRYIRDTAAEDAKMWQKIEEVRVAEMGKQLAAVALGGTAQVRPTPTVATPAKPAVTTEAEDIAGAIVEGAAVAAGAEGAETLTD